MPGNTLFVLPSDPAEARREKRWAVIKRIVFALVLVAALAAVGWFLVWPMLR
jgi:cell division septal protein FtsQ